MNKTGKFLSDEYLFFPCNARETQQFHSGDSTVSTLGSSNLAGSDIRQHDRTGFQDAQNEICVQKIFDALVKSRISDGFVKSSQVRRANLEE